ANALLDNGRTTAVVDAAAASRAGELGFEELARELAAGTVGALFFVGTNPALVDARLGAALPRVPFSLSTSDRLDETAALTRAHAPEGHFLEAWRDARPRPGVDVMGQPCVTPLHDTRGRTASLLTWAGEKGDAHAFIKARWEREVLGGGAGGAGKDAHEGGQLLAFWDAAVRDGIVDGSVAPTVPELAARPDAALALLAAARPAPAAGAMELVLYASIGLGDGTGASANNAWLQELPDPISKVTWGNYAALSPARARALGVEDGDLVDVRAVEAVVRLPALRQPGLPVNVVAVAVGHGRARAGRIAAGHGTDAWPLAQGTRDAGGQGKLARAGIAVAVTRAGGQRPLALAQTHASQEGRELVRQIDLEDLLDGGDAGEGLQADKHRGLWSGHEYPGHRWAMAIDLNACTGCGACVVSCNAENNIPVVGETEARRRREMHWLRIDRYYGGEPDAPEVLHQ